MNVPALLALLSIPFAAMFINGTGDNEDIYILSYVTALGFTFGAIFLMGGYHVLPLSAIVIDSAPR